MNFFFFFWQFVRNSIWFFSPTQVTIFSNNSQPLCIICFYVYWFFKISLTFDDNFNLPIYFLFIWYVKNKYFFCLNFNIMNIKRIWICIYIWCIQINLFRIYKVKMMCNLNTLYLSWFTCIWFSRSSLSYQARVSLLSLTSLSMYLYFRMYIIFWMYLNVLDTCVWSLNLIKLVILQININLNN